MQQTARTDECRTRPQFEADEHLRQVIPEVVHRLVDSCLRPGCFDHVSPIPIPTQETVKEIITLARDIIFPGYFTADRIDQINMEYHLGRQVALLQLKLAEQIVWSVRHECFRRELECAHCLEQGRDKSLKFIEALPKLREIMADDVRAAYEGDPAAQSYDQIIFSYPGLCAVTVYRLAHILHELEVPLLPRIMTESAHGLTGIDIHPGARIGRSFFIDHGSGVVIGETTEIGDRVRLYQGVTLGALSLPRDAGEQWRGRKRHPTIEDEVIVYSGATILGGKTVIGARSVIGGNVWLTESVPPDTKVLIKTPELIFIGQEKG